MIYPQNFESKIGFDNIRTLLQGHCLSPLGEERVRQMAFSTNFQDIRRHVRQTMEFVDIITKEDFPAQNFFDVRHSLKRIRIEKTFLDVQELFDLQRSLDTIHRIVLFLSRCVDDEDTIPKYIQLNALTTDIATYPHLVKRIDQILDKYGNVKDTASPALFAIRRELAATSGSISKTLAAIMRNAKSEGLIDKDMAPTLRDGRLVIPVAPALKRKIRGIVHDESDSGRTVYIEPAEVVEANNRIRELESEERHEIKRILMEFADTVRPDIPDMMHSYEFLANIDFIRAKACFAIRIEATEPNIEDRQIVDWALATHPLLRLKFNQMNTTTDDGNPRKIIPLDITLTKRNRILLISGPNAGGKSVCLKTTGLLQYMLQCGMPVPMAKSSVMGIFKSIFIDIGDEQSIENDLSTYSSHLLNMKNMLRHCDGASLILIDEFGSGTEPQIGGAIAQAILARFNKRHSFGVITTHYQNLKHFAQETDGITSGAMLYDRQQMCPLYQLQIGNPGSSFAIEIARKTGIPDDIIHAASELVGQDYINSDKYLQDIVRDKRYWENKRQTIHQHEKHMEQTIERYEQEITALHRERRDIIARAKAEAEELLKQSNARIEQTIREIKEAQAEKERTRSIRQEFGDFKQHIRDIDADKSEERIQKQMERIKKRQERRKNGSQKDGDSTIGVASVTSDTTGNATSTQQELKHTQQLQQGDYVRMKGQTSIGVIRKMNGKEAQVAFGSMLVNVKVSKLQASEAPRQEMRATTFIGRETQDNIRETTLNFRQEIDLRGMRGEEAIQAVLYFIDDAVVAGVHSVRILHGTGNGILRTLIRQYLATVPSVSDFHDEHVQLGGAGITVVELI